MVDDYSFRPDLKNRARKAFDDVRGKGVSQMSSPQKQRVDRVAAKLAKHVEKHRPRWVEREFQKLKLRQKRDLKLTRSDGPRPPIGAVRSRPKTAQELRHQAAHNVRKRIVERKANVASMAHGYRQAAARTRSQTRARSRSQT